MNDSIFVLFIAAALFLIGLGWYIVLQELDFQQEDRDERDERAGALLAYQRRYNDRIAVLAEKEKPQIAAVGR